MDYFYSAFLAFWSLTDEVTIKYYLKRAMQMFIKCMKKFSICVPAVQIIPANGFFKANK